MLCLAIIIVLAILLIRLKKRLSLSNSAMDAIRPSEYKTLGNFATEKGELRLARRCYRKATELESYAQKTPYKLGIAYFQAEQYEKAIVELSKCLKDEITKPEAYFYLAYSHLHLGNLDSAEDYFKAVLQMRPNDSYTYVGLGIIAQSQRQYAQAKHYYEKALELNPNCQEARENLEQLQ